MVNEKIRIQVMYRAFLAEREHLKIERDLIDEKLIAADMLIEEIKRKLPKSSNIELRQKSNVYYGKKLLPCLRMIIKHSSSKIDTNEIEKKLIDGGYNHSGKRSFRHSLTCGLGNLVHANEIGFTGNKGNRKYSLIKSEDNPSNDEVENE
ncbi:hypothetical protein K8T06_14170 [bacterium]|nr:hypothetical protein [bacterium]